MVSVSQAAQARIAEFEAELETAIGGQLAAAEQAATAAEASARQQVDGLITELRRSGDGGSASQAKAAAPVVSSPTTLSAPPPVAAPAAAIEAIGGGGDGGGGGGGGRGGESPSAKERGWAAAHRYYMTQSWFVNTVLEKGLDVPGAAVSSPAAATDWYAPLSNIARFSASSFARLGWCVRAPGGRGMVALAGAG